MKTEQWSLSILLYVGGVAGFGWQWFCSFQSYISDSNWIWCNMPFRIVTQSLNHDLGMTNKNGLTDMEALKSDQLQAHQPSGSAKHFCLCSSVLWGGTVHTPGLVGDRRLPFSDSLSRAHCVSSSRWLTRPSSPSSHEPEGIRCSPPHWTLCPAPSREGLAFCLAGLYCPSP